MPPAGQWANISYAYVLLMLGDTSTCLTTLADGSKRHKPSDDQLWVNQSLVLEAACLVKAGDIPSAKAAWGKISTSVEGNPNAGDEEKLGFIETLLRNDVKTALPPILKE